MGLNDLVDHIIELGQSAGGSMSNQWKQATREIHNAWEEAGGSISATWQVAGEYFSDIANDTGETIISQAERTGITVPNPQEFETIWDGLNTEMRGNVLAEGLQGLLSTVDIEELTYVGACTYVVAAALVVIGGGLGGPVGAALGAAEGIPAGFLVCSFIAQQLIDHDLMELDTGIIGAHGPAESALDVEDTIF